jgi:hypothetical protein
MFDRRREVMGRLLAWLLVLVLITIPALASSPASEAEGAAAATAVSPAELQEMKALLKAQAEALREQRAAVERAEEKIRELEQRLGVAPAVQPAVMTTASPAMAVEPKAGAKQESAPLYFRIGAANFTPGGFLDFVSFFRGTNVGGIATAFGSIPYNNTVQGHSSEVRMSSQASRLALKIETNAGANKVLGYVETDFVGNSAANQFVTSNAMTLRMRMYLADVRRGKWEIMGGQAWSLMTPGRHGLGVLPSDLLIPLVGDANYQVGFPWARQAQFRLTYHPTDNTALAVSVENPQQFIGSPQEVAFPSAYKDAMNAQFDAANLSTAPNLHPDIIAKIAHDGKVGSRNLHIEAGGILRSFKAVYSPTASVTGPFVNHSLTEGGITAGANFEAFKNFTLVSNAVWGAGTGRYLAGLGPDVVVRPIALSPTTFDITLTPVHSGSMMAGFEWQPKKTTMLSAYYGGIYAGRNAFQDVTLVAKPYIGFGGPGSANTNNRAIQEATLALTQTFWKSPNFGALQFISQGSYLTRSPWFVALGAPKNAHLFMSTLGIRYVLP